MTILCRNAYLAVSPSRVSEDFGWVGERRVREWDAQGFGKKIKFRDWTGGDELDSVSDRWVGWEDALKNVDAVVFTVGDLGKRGRTRPVDVARAAREAGEAMPRRFVHLAPVDDLVKRTGAFADKRIETLRDTERSWKQTFGTSGRCLRAGTVLGLPKFAESLLFPAPKDLRRVARGPWVHLDDLTDAVLEACSDAEASSDPVLVEPSSVRTIEGGEGAIRRKHVASVIGAALLAARRREAERSEEDNVRYSAFRSGGFRDTRLSGNCARSAGRSTAAKMQRSGPSTKVSP